SNDRRVRRLLRGRSFFRDGFGSRFSSGHRLRNCFSSLFHLSQNFYGDAGGDIAVQPDGDLEFAQALERLAELNLAAVDLEALRRQVRSNIGRSDRAEKLA